MVKVKWSTDVLFALKEICEYIAEDSKFYAKIFYTKIFEVVEHLETFPKIAKTIPESDDPNVREIIYKNHRIIYQVYDSFL